MNDIATKPAAAGPAVLIEEYIRLRDGKKVADDTYDAWVQENYKNRMVELEGILLQTLNDLGSDSIAAPSGTVYKKISTSVTVADASEFRRHVIGSEQWDLIDWRANKTVINELVENNELLPPGINRTAFWTVGIRRKS
jgi:hypothetical protein